VHGGTDGHHQEAIRVVDDTAGIRNKYPRNVSNSEPVCKSPLSRTQQQQELAWDGLSALVLGRAGLYGFRILVGQEILSSLEASRQASGDLLSAAWARS
jgi:hypothetical protein